MRTTSEARGAYPTEPAASAASRTRMLRVASYNIHGWIGTDGRRDPERTLAVVRSMDADVIALQEVMLDQEPDVSPLFVGLPEYVKLLGRTEMRAGQHYGNVLLVRRPVRHVERIELPVRAQEPRGAMDVAIELPDGLVHVLATHLGLGWRERRRQISSLIARMGRTTAAREIVLGDFNEWIPWPFGMRRVERSMGGAPRLRTFPSRFPLWALDRIWVRPRSALRAVRVVHTAQAVRASDHLPIVADVSFGSSA